MITVDAIDALTTTVYLPHMIMTELDGLKKLNKQMWCKMRLAIVATFQALQTARTAQVSDTSGAGLMSSSTRRY